MHKFRIFFQRSLAVVPQKIFGSRAESLLTIGLRFKLGVCAIVLEIVIPWR